MFLASAPVATFRCPGEPYDISPAIHRARQAAGYDKCRRCAHRDVAQVFGSADSTLGKAAPRDPHPPTHHVRQIGSIAASSPGGSDAKCGLFRLDGVRGVYLNELDRRIAGEIAGAYASVLWNREPARILSEARPFEPTAADEEEIAAEGVTVLRSGLPGPSIVLAHDDRSSAADLAMGVGLALRRMGCVVIDLGFAVRPEFCCAVQHLQSAGGIHITGAGESLAYTGLDFVGRQAEPWSLGGDLDLVASVWREGYARPSRRPGGLRSFRFGSPYGDRYRPLVHGLRPLRIAWSCAPQTVSAMASRLLARSACQLIPFEVSTRERKLFSADDLDVARLRHMVTAQNAHLGMLVADNGQQCSVIDDAGQIVSAARLERLLRQEACPAAATTSADGEGDALVADVGESLQTAYRRLSAHDFAFHHGPAGSFWFRTPEPTCDALLTLLHLLRALSHSDAKLSELATAPE